MTILLDKFPGTPRPVQKEILTLVDDAIKSGYKKIIIQSPTGTGKSFLAATISRMCGSSSILTATTELQDQYANDFPWMRTVRGKTHFPCLQLNMTETCEKGLCFDPTTKENCSYKPHKTLLDIKNKGTLKEKITYKNHNFAEPCYYYIQKYAGNAASYTVYNYAEFFTSVFHTKDAPARKALIFDEAHSIENSIVSFVSVDVIRSHVEFLGMEMPNQDTNVDQWIDFVNDMNQSYAEFIKECKQYLEEKLNDEKYNAKNLALIETRHERLSYILKEMKKAKENFVISKATKDKQGNLTRVGIQPINVGAYLNDIYQFGDLVVFMSATIDDRVFCRSAGISREQCKFIQMKKSPFPIENRPIHFLNIARLNKNSMEAAMPAIIDSINSILNKHQNEKGIILTTSYKQIDEIMQGVSKENLARLYKTGTELTRSELIKIHQNSETPTVIISPSMYEGIDLKDEMSRFQIIVKAPYADLSDGRIAAKLKVDPEWYTYHSAMKLVQGVGRSIRHENDHATTYILDEGATDLIRRAGTMVPEWFKESFIKKITLS